MELRHFDTVAAYFARAGEMLCAHEPHHAMLFEQCERRDAPSESSGHPPYLATVEEFGSVVAAAVLAQTQPLMLSHAPPPVASLLAANLHPMAVVIPVSGVPGASRRATETDRDLLATWV